MTAELWQRLKPLFHEAMERGPKDRAAFVEEACANSPELKEHLLELLIAEQETIGVPELNFDSFAAHMRNETRFEPGDLILDRFRILRLIGWGGMGEVYQAEDLELGLIALKTVRNTIASSPAALERFRREVHLARKVSGPQICRIHELFIVPAIDGHPVTVFLTMEYLEGTTLSSKLNDGGPIPWKQARSIALDVCKGLELIHGEGIIHRDLKSTNIMICQRGASVRTVLMDFGLARPFGFNDALPQVASEAGWQEGSVAGAIMGTPEYMAPEQFESSAVSPATDVYALGIVLYELMTGTHPYPAHGPIAAAIGRAHRPRPASSLVPSLPRHWDGVIERCLEYEPEKRYQSVREVAKALRPGPANLRYIHKDWPWATFALFAVAMAALIWASLTFWQSLGYYHPNREALRWYAPGVVALRDGTYVKAIRYLQTAIAKDPGFLMAHARLAEAWEDLDFQGNAQREMLIASSGGHRAPPLDRMYLSAIQASVLGDYQAAIDRYDRIAASAAPSEEAPAHVDLGMAYERAGDPQHALAEYARASTLDPDDAASYMHIAVLQARQHHVPDSNSAFQQVETLYRNSSNLEGLAELDYERGYAANRNGELAEAKRLLQKASQEADDIGSVQLKIRTLTQLSSLANGSGANQEAVSDAEQAIQLARDNQLESWAANGFVRLGSAQLVGGHFSEADKSLQDAFSILRQSPQPRTEALANATLASLKNQEGLPDQVTAPAQSALNYYRRNGFFSEGTYAAILLIRAQRDNGQYQQALQSANELLALTKQSGVRSLMMQAEEDTGTVYLRMEQYPDALTHYQNALALTNTARSRAFQALHCGEALWRLGRYAEAEMMLRSVSGTETLVTEAGINRVGSLLSQRRFKPALELAKQLQANKATMNSDDEDELQQAIAISEAHLGMKTQALEYIAGQPASVLHGKPEDIATRELADAEIYLALGMNNEAEEAAAQAHDYFKGVSQKDSLLRSTLLEAAAFKSVKDEANYNKYFAEAIDTVNTLRNTWSPQSLQSSLARPDLQIAGTLR